LFEHDLGAERPGVVRRGHDAAVGAGELDRDQVAATWQGQSAAQRKEIAALAERADDVYLRLLAVVAGQHGDRVLGPVEGGSEQIVAAAVADGDRPAAGLLHVQDAGDERADGTREVASGLQDKRRVEAPRDLGERVHVGGEVRLGAP